MKSILYKNSTITYLKLGHGSAKVFCFHGFDEDAHSFSVFEPYLANVTLFAIDMPFHGNTYWKRGLDVKVEDMVDIIDNIRMMEQIDLMEPYALMGYSMGARIALSVYEQNAPKISKLILIAPDGIKKNFWYSLATGSKQGNKVFKKTMVNPGWFIKFVNNLSKLKIINPGMAKFVSIYLDDKKARVQLYNIWTAFRHFKPDIAKITHLIEALQTPVCLFYGRFDKVITHETGEKFKARLNGNCHLFVLEGGHQLLNSRHVAAIARFVAM